MEPSLMGSFEPLCGCLGVPRGICSEAKIICLLTFYKNWLSFFSAILVSVDSLLYESFKILETLLMWLISLWWRYSLSFVKCFRICWRLFCILSYIVIHIIAAYNFFPIWVFNIKSRLLLFDYCSHLIFWIIYHLISNCID